MKSLRFVHGGVHCQIVRRVAEMQWKPICAKVVWARHPQERPHHHSGRADGVELDHPSPQKLDAALLIPPRPPHHHHPPPLRPTPTPPSHPPPPRFLMKWWPHPLAYFEAFCKPSAKQKDNGIGQSQSWQKGVSCIANPDLTGVSAGLALRRLALFTTLLWAFESTNMADDYGRFYDNFGGGGGGGGGHRWVPTLSCFTFANSRSEPNLVGQTAGIIMDAAEVVTGEEVDIEEIVARDRCLQSRLSLLTWGICQRRRFKEIWTPFLKACR